ncbi:metal ABC transporter solute-binding protein, Zn/Mn family [Microbacterium ulmi]|uniref:Zinc ABC transporter solute-binding protein n=1 Tax=Microbacterium ulmi TaxID=179095 RepID=A0A7Y2Q189_9MICO|nr:zinc ABC transporter substrate-binding protein [Microbacterium ulmi]NII69294.1 zinc/manganese transport system substrate-binding protein [Microbacterium ulmi]NNH04092.1 zinc ABC transporter solute-binding protein [Microbacterium ulmi]
MPRRLSAVAVLVAASVLALAGCASSAPGAGGGDGRVAIVASTDVYAQIAEEIGGDLADVTAIIDSGAQDPHEFEASARDQLTVSRADLLIQNGAGYDSFMESLIDATGTQAPMLTAVEFSPAWPGEHADEGDDHSDEGDHEDHDHIEGFNEHVWYDPQTVGKLANAIADELSDLAPEHANAFAANADAFLAEIAELGEGLDAIAADHAGTRIFVTEPVPLYLTEAAGLVNATPAEFSEAVEEGQDVPPATLLAALGLVESGDVRVVIVNAQTGGAETTQVIDTAKAHDIPVLEVTETLPEGQTYISWMQANIDALAAALAA